MRDPGGELVIGHFDDDGRVLGVYGDLPGLGLETVQEAEFVKPSRYSTDVVLVDDKVLIRKDFRGNSAPFVREWYCLSRLYSKANVSAVHHVDEKRCLLYKNLIPGRKIRDTLIDAGAKIRDLDLGEDPETAGLDPVARAETVSARARALLPVCFSEQFLRDLEQQLDQVHSEGITGFGFTIGNVIVDQHEKPWFFDFEGARIFESCRGLIFAYRRDQDRRRFNRHYGERLLTEQSARRALSSEAGKTLSKTKTQGWYGPIDFGNGLTVGGIGSTDTGQGRWEYLNRRVVSPLVRGKRLLDLGTNNGCMAIGMLRAGAREVVGVELSPELVERAKLVQRVFEWRDMRPYPMALHNCDILEILKADWGCFDVVTAFCSLYFLDANAMARVTQRVSELAPVFVVQANTRVPLADDGRAGRASLSFLKELLERNGFPRIDIHAPKGYPRPLLVAKTVSNRIEGFQK
jgi:hypothetical protein